MVRYAQIGLSSSTSSTSRRVAGREAHGACRAFNTVGALDNAWWCFAAASRQPDPAVSFFLAQVDIASHRIGTQRDAAQRSEHSASVYYRRQVN